MIKDIKGPHHITSMLGRVVVTPLSFKGLPTLSYRTVDADREKAAPVWGGLSGHGGVLRQLFCPSRLQKLPRVA